MKSDRYCIKCEKLTVHSYGSEAPHWCCCNCQTFYDGRKVRTAEKKAFAVDELKQLTEKLDDLTNETLEVSRRMRILEGIIKK